MVISATLHAMVSNADFSALMLHIGESFLSFLRFSPISFMQLRPAPVHVERMPCAILATFQASLVILLSSASVSQATYHQHPPAEPNAPVRISCRLLLITLSYFREYLTMRCKRHGRCYFYTSAVSGVILLRVLATSL